MTATRVLLLPGLYNSGPQHWQSFWEREHPAFQRLQHRDWDTPDRSDWVATLQDAIAASPTPVILVAHSLACCLVAHWSAAHTGPIQGALLVAPSDVEADTYPPAPPALLPCRSTGCPFRAAVVGSPRELPALRQAAWLGERGDSSPFGGDPSTRSPWRDPHSLRTRPSAGSGRSRGVPRISGRLVDARGGAV